MNSINLLPDTFRVKTSTVKTAKVLKKISIVLFVILILTVSTSIGLFLMYRNRISNATETQTTLKNQIKALEETEQRLILVKDRLGKVSEINKIGSSKEELEGLRFIMENFGTEVTLTQIVAEQNVLGMQVESATSIEMFNFLDLLRSSGEFKKIVMGELQFNPGSGFQTQLTFNKK